MRWAGPIPKGRSVHHCPLRPPLPPLTSQAQVGAKLSRAQGALRDMRQQAQAAMAEAITLRTELAAAQDAQVPALQRRLDQPRNLSANVCAGRACLNDAQFAQVVRRGCCNLYVQVRLEREALFGSSPSPSSPSPSSPPPAPGANGRSLVRRAANAQRAATAAFALSPSARRAPPRPQPSDDAGTPPPSSAPPSPAPLSSAGGGAARPTTASPESPGPSLEGLTSARPLESLQSLAAEMQGAQDAMHQLTSQLAQVRGAFVVCGQAGPGAKAVCKSRRTPD